MSATLFSYDAQAVLRDRGLVTGDWLLNGKEGRPPPFADPGAQHPRPATWELGVPYGCMFELRPDFIFNSRVSQDLQEQWVPRAKWATLEKG